MTKRMITAIMLVLVLVTGCLTPFAFAQATEPAPAQATDAPAEDQTPANEDAQAGTPTEAPPAEEQPTAEQPAAEAAPAFDYATAADDFVMVTINGQDIKKGDVATLYDQMQQQYAAYGMDFTSADNQMALLNYVMSMVMQQTLMEQKGVELGFDQLTDEELAQLTEKAQSDYDATLAMYKQYFTVEGKTEEEIETEVKDYLAGIGYSIDALLETAKTNQLLNRVYEYIVKDVNVTDADVEANYQTMVETQKATYEATPAQYASDMSSGATVYYTPEGCRTVKHILVMFDKAADVKALTAELEALEDEAARAEKQAEIDELTREINVKLDEIKARIDAGEDFQALIDEYGEDGGMKSGTTAQTGYYMNAETTQFVPEFTQAGMALEKVGDVSEPVLTSYGYHILRYNSDVPSGETPIDDVREAIKATLTNEASQAAFANAINEWGNAATIVSHMN